MKLMFDIYIYSFSEPSWLGGLRFRIYLISSILLYSLFLDFVWCTGLPCAYTFFDFLT
jgi:hypothetical protein